MSKRTIIYLLIVLLTAFLVTSVGCDNMLGKPDIRNEYGDDKKPDYFGWRWDFKW